MHVSGHALWCAVHAFQFAPFCVRVCGVLCAMLSDGLPEDMRELYVACERGGSKSLIVERPSGWDLAQLQQWMLNPECKYCRSLIRQSQGSLMLL